MENSYQTGKNGPNETHTIHNLLRRASDLLETETVSFLQLDANSASFRLASGSHQIDESLKCISIPLAESIAGKVTELEHSLIVHDCSAEPAHCKWLDAAAGHPTRNMLAVPIICDGNLLGVVEALNKRNNAPFTPHDQAILECICAELGCIVWLESQQEQAARSERMAQIGENMVEYAHSLKNQINQLEGSLSILRKGMEQRDLPLLQQVWPVFERSAEKVARLARNLLGLAAEAHHQMEKLAVEPIIQQLVEEARTRAAQAGITLRTELHGGWAPVVARADQMRDLLLNLLINAIEALADSRTAQGVICIRTACRLETLFISIHDNGPGIPPELLKNIFKPFYTTKSYGTGLGLPMVQKLVQSMNGQVRIESDTGRGTTVELSFPVCAAA